MFRAVAWLMAALFALAMVVQYNDPDPVRWVSIYGSALAVTAFAGWRGAVPVVGALMVGGVAAGWGLLWSTDVSDLATYTHMFDRWEMNNVPIEEARETSGLFLVAAWMAVLAVHGWRRAGAIRKVPGVAGGAAVTPPPL
jgi:Transmembrane family 220, helix